MDFNQKIILGKSNLKCGRIGVASSFKAPEKAFEEAFERGCNYFTWGTFIKGRSSNLEKVLKKLINKGKRDQIVLSIISYAHSDILTRHFIERDLKKIGTDYADVLLLGYYSRKPAERLLKGAMKMKEKGLIRAIGMTTHNRKIVPILADEGVIDIFHVRYNAVNQGAEKDIFPHLSKENPPGIVSFTATAWKKLLMEKKMPPGERPPTAQECYRFVLTNPNVDICMMGANNLKQMQENLQVLEQGPMSDEEIKRMRRVGDYIYKKPR